MAGFALGFRLYGWREIRPQRISSRRESMNRITLKSLAVFALMLSVGSAAAHANDEHVKMTFSGTAGNSAINLQQPNTSNDEDTFAGEGTLGDFTLRNVRAISNAPGSSTTCR